MKYSISVLIVSLGIGTKGIGLVFGKTLAIALLYEENILAMKY